MTEKRGWEWDDGETGVGAGLRRNGGESGMTEKRGWERDDGETGVGA